MDNSSQVLVDAFFKWQKVPDEPQHKLPAINASSYAIIKEGQLLLQTDPPVKEPFLIEENDLYPSLMVQDRIEDFITSLGKPAPGVASIALRYWQQKKGFRLSVNGPFIRILPLAK